MTIKETKLYLERCAKELPLIPIKWIESKLPEYKESIHNKRKLLYNYQILYHYKDVKYIIEICYFYNDKKEAKVISQYIYGLKYKNNLYKNAYFIMKWGYRANASISLKKVNKRYWNSEYIFNYDSVYKGSNFIRSITTLWDDIPIYETLYHINLKHLYRYIINPNLNKPYSALGLNKYISKTKFKDFINWVKQFKSFRLDLYKDFIKMAKNRNYKNIFINNWLRLHDEWSGIINQRKNEKLFKDDLKIWNKINDINDFNIIPIKSKDEMIKFGNEMNNCLKRGNFNYKTIYKIESWETKTPLAMEFDNGIIHQLLGYKNQEISNDLYKVIQKATQTIKQSEKEVSNGTI